MRLRLALLLTLSIPMVCFSQKEIAITIDDVPNTRLGHSKLLDRIDSMAIPATIFINEVKVTQHGNETANKLLLQRWISDPLITPGNHTYSHQRASSHAVETYRDEIIKGESLSRTMTEQQHKSLKHFRFPYNDLGRDSLQQDSLKRLLAEYGYTIAPFTVESSDWMFNSVYQRYLRQGDAQKAREIGQLYVEYTLTLCTFYDSTSWSHYGRSIKQIYLCHDNELNRDYLPMLIQSLKEQGYSISSYDNCLHDAVYAQPTYFWRKFGISWFYRWISDVDQRNALGRAEPTCPQLDAEYDALQH